MLGRILKGTIWVAGGVAALALVSYAVLFAANLNDRPPSPDIASIQALQQSLPAISEAENSYVFMLGFACAPDADPLRLGLERKQWLENAGPEFDYAKDPLSDEYDFRTRRSDAVAELAEACSASEAECLHLLNRNQGTVIQWLADESWLLDRYRSLISMRKFRETVPFKLLAPLPSYSVIFEGQRQHLASAWLAATDGDAAKVRATLDRDLAFWRLVPRDSDVLITKMIATAAIIQHFKRGNLVLQRLPRELAAAAIPDSWRIAISDEERSMRRSLAGEWGFFDESTKRIFAAAGDGFGDWLGLTDSTTLDRVAWALLKPLWQPQDTRNRHARLMLDLGNAFDVPYDEIPRAVVAADELQTSAYRRFGRLYNVGGDIVMSANNWTLSDYALRVSDLEGIRRAALLAAELRAEGVTRDDVMERMLESEIVDPYNEEPYTWHDENNAIVFYGLEPHERSRHEIIY